MQGLIFIPDISGFTNFVKSIDIDLGVTITSELLNEIIDNNPLDVELSEIEGDAVLFYQVGKPIALHKVFAGFKSMYEAFNNKFQSLKAQYGIKADLSLKFIAHYGEINVYDIKGFKKLYGQTVIEAHSLLKNGSGASDYILITEDYFSALNQKAEEAYSCTWQYCNYCSQVYNELRKIGYHFFTYFPNYAFQDKYTYRQKLQPFYNTKAYAYA